MNYRHASTALALCLTPLMTGSAAYAQDQYFAVSGGLSFLSDSNNSGQFTSDFTTGTGTTIPLGTPLPAGTDVGWNTDFNTGYTFGGAWGRRYGPIRAEVELAYQRNGVDDHSGVTAAGIPLDGEDAGVLISGSDALGATVGAIVGDGQGSVKTLFGMVNGYYDLDLGNRLRPYIGAGIGLGRVDVTYNPSDVGIINGSSWEFAYQLMAGASFALDETSEVFAGYRWRATSGTTKDVDLFPADLKIQNETSVIEAGVRFSF